MLAWCSLPPERVVDILVALVDYEGHAAFPHLLVSAWQAENEHSLAPYIAQSPLSQAKFGRYPVKYKMFQTGRSTEPYTREERAEMARQRAIDRLIYD